MKKSFGATRIDARRSMLAVLVALLCGCANSSTPGGTGISSTQGTPESGAGTMTPTQEGGSGGSSGSSGSSSGSSGGSSGTQMPTNGSGNSSSGAGTGSSGSGSSSGGVAEAGTGDAGPATPTGDAGFVQLPRVTTTDGLGPFTSVVKVMNTPPGGWMIYPTDIGKGGMKHPLFIFGPGGGTTPATYDQMGMHWDMYGSYGFVIYVLPMSTGNGADMKAGLDWLISENDDMSSPLYHNLDTGHVAAAGHSEGGITVFAFMPDDRVTTTVIISGGSFDGTGPSHLRNDTMYLCGPDGTSDIAEPQCETDYMNCTIPIFYTKVQGSTHITSGRMGWPATIAWLLWHLAGQEDQWKQEFLMPTGQFQTGIYVSETKNWP